MSIQLDTNILTRLSQPTDPAHGVAQAAVAKLASAGQDFGIVPLNLYEWWTVATRPIANNGLGLSVQEAHGEIVRLTGLFPLRPDDPAIVGVWEALVVAHDCKGKVAHDARLVAAMQTHGLNEILTFNTADFARFPGIVAIHPSTV
jgi:predicted nucleic acid-binding protein